MPEPVSSLNKGMGEENRDDDEDDADVMVSFLDDVDLLVVVFFDEDFFCCVVLNGVVAFEAEAERGRLRFSRTIVEVDMIIYFFRICFFFYISRIPIRREVKTLDLFAIVPEIIKLTRK